MEFGKFEGQNSMVEEEFEFLGIEEEEILSLSHWEFIEASDADSEETDHHHSNSEEEDKDEASNGGSDGLTIRPASVSSSISPISSPVTVPIGPHAHLPIHPRLVRFLAVGLDHDDGDEDEDEGHDNDDDGYGLDDELVPWSVSDKFGGQRMRKLGKRTFPKMNNSKRSPYMLARPGCVRGNHGLGLKHIH